MSEFGPQPEETNLESLHSHSAQPERVTDGVILSSITPETYKQQMNEIRQVGGDYGFMLLGELKSEVPQFIMEMAGGIEEARDMFDERMAEPGKKLTDPEGTLILLDRNIPATAKIQARISETFEVAVKGQLRRIYIYTDETHDNLAVAVALTDKFVDDLYDYIKAKELAA